MQKCLLSPHSPRGTYDWYSLENYPEIDEDKDVDIEEIDDDYKEQMHLDAAAANLSLFDKEDTEGDENHSSSGDSKHSHKPLEETFEVEPKARPSHGH